MRHSSIYRTILVGANKEGSRVAGGYVSAGSAGKQAGQSASMKLKSREPT